MGCASCLDRRPSSLGEQALIHDGCCFLDRHRCRTDSACVGLYAAVGSDLRDKVEQFIPQLRGQAPWAAIAAAVSVVAQAMEKLPVKPASSSISTARMRSSISSSTTRMTAGATG
jgi:hypothetical protein